MSITLFAVNNPDFELGRVIVVQNGEVVADGRDLIRVDDGKDVHTDVYMLAIDAATFEAWMQKQNGRRLN